MIAWDNLTAAKCRFNPSIRTCDCVSSIGVGYTTRYNIRLVRRNLIS